MEILSLDSLGFYYEGILALMPGHVYLKDKHGILRDCNNNLAKTLKLASRKDIIGKTDYDIASKDEAEAIKKIDFEVMAQGIERTDEEYYTLPDGSHAIYLTQRFPVFDQQGEVIGIIGISLDITERRKIQQELLETQHKLDGMTLVSASIAHEIRTPLASLEISADTLKDILPPLIEVYERSDMMIDSTEFDKSTLARLKELPDIIKRETQGANTFINMLLMNLNPKLGNNIGQIFSMQSCINEALERYPFKPAQRQLIVWQSQDDFAVKGKKELVVHILFNLIKNALFYVGNGKIEIRLEPDTSNNRLIFMDTGAGILPEILPHIFTKFFSRTRNGSGIGLAYCKTVMEALGGSIACESIKGSYTQFILSFPLLREKSK